MLKKFTAYAMVGSMLMLPIGCAKVSERQNYDNQLAKRSLYHSKAKENSYKYAFEALENIMESYEEKMKEETTKASTKALFTYTAYDKTGKKILGKYEVADVTSGYVSIINSMTLAQSRERVIREFVPIFKGIADSLVENGTPPKSWIDVASEFVKHTPMLATMGAMYGLGKAAIDSAGNRITTNLNDEAQMSFNNNDIDGSGNNLSVDDGVLSTYEQDTKNSGTDIGNDKSQVEMAEPKVEGVE